MARQQEIHAKSTTRCCAREQAIVELLQILAGIEDGMMHVNGTFCFRMEIHSML